MNPQIKAVKLKYLALAKAGVRKIWDEYFSLPEPPTKKEQYKLVEKYHKKTDKFLDDINRQGFTELRLLGLL